MSSFDQIFTTTSAYSLAGVAAVGFIAVAAANTLLPKNVRRQDKFTFIWLVSLKSGELWRAVG
jgi:hypothetical protein